MAYRHKIIENHHGKVLWALDRETAYIPNIGDTIRFPEGWKPGETFKVASIHHYIVDRLIAIYVDKV
jgi:hypothetical protein